jgi:hypothetical protein
MRIQPGMEAYQVKQILGDPVDRKFNEGQDEWFYRMDVGKDGKKTKIVYLENNRVVRLGDDLLGEERNFQLAKARLEGPQVVVNSGAEAAQTLPCAHSNKYGRFSDGGGCNEFGCWPPGGSCNKFGCTAEGECKNPNCPHAITSYHCLADQGK